MNKSLWPNKRFEATRGNLARLKLFVVREGAMKVVVGRGRCAWPTALSLAFLLNGCSCRIPVSVTGTLHNGIVFALSDSREITYAAVMTRDAQGRWQEIWRIDGEDKVVSIGYGEATSRLKTTIAAQGLRKNQLYTFSIEDDDFWGPCVGTVSFVVTEDGAVKECGSDSCPRKYD